MARSGEEIEEESVILSGMDDKHRENYLGHSVNAPVGRWQKNRDLNWYNKDNERDITGNVRLDEIKSIKDQEEEAMAEALGFTGGKKKIGEAAVSKQEIKRLLALDGDDPDEVPRHVKGLGFGRLDIQTVLKPMKGDDDSFDPQSILEDSKVSKKKKKDKKEKKEKKEKKKEKDEPKRKRHHDDDDREERKRAHH